MSTSRFLLLLPPAPSSLGLSSLREAFGDTISQVLKEVASHSSGSDEAAILEIALACPHLVGTRGIPRSTLYAPTQRLLAAIYKLVCVIASQDRINIEDADGVDVRIITVAWSPSSDSYISHSTQGSVVDLSTLATSGRQWQFAFGVESDDGEAFVKAFVRSKGHGGQVEHHATISTSESLPPQQPSDAKDSRPPSEAKHSHVAVGGTFDHIHVGHKLLLAMTLFAVDQPLGGSEEHSVTIGITGDQLLVNKKFAQVLQSWEDRQASVRKFVDATLNFASQSAQVTTRNDPGPNGKTVDLHYPSGLIVKCTEIQDPFGPTITEEQIGALIISAETRSGGKAVNEKRKEKGWKQLEVFEVDVLDSDESGEVKEGFDSKLSSTAIREKIAAKQSAA